MNFDQALDEMMEGKYLARRAWRDPNRYCYLIILREGRLHAQNVDDEDAKAEDWYVVGCIQ